MCVSSLGWEDPLEEGGPGNPLQHSRLENPMDRGAWWATVHVVAESDTEATQQACMLSDQCELIPHCGFDLHFSDDE